MTEAWTALSLVFAGDTALYAIVRLSLIVSLVAVAVAALIGLPLGAALALARFPGRQTIVVLLNACMGLAPGRGRPRGLPPALALRPARAARPPLHPAGDGGGAGDPGDADHRRAHPPDHRGSLVRIPRRAHRHGCQCPPARVTALLWDARFSLVTILLAGFGRAAAEVGAVMIVGGNIDGFTRTMTTAIALETSKGDLPLALGLGLVLISIVIAVNALAWGARRFGERHAG